MSIERFLIPDNSKRSFVKKFTTHQGATIQKISQLFDNSEDRTLDTDKSVSTNLLNFIEKELPDLYSQISSISDNFFTGSMANVHKCILSDGTTLALKSLRNDIEEKIDKDLKNINSLLKKINPFVNPNKFFHIDSFSNDFIHDLRRECDLRNEAKNIQSIMPNFKDFTVLRHPKIFHSWSNDKILVYEWLDEDSEITEVNNLDNKDDLLYELCLFFLIRPLQTGYLQEDANISNFLISKNELFIIDYGKVTFIPLNVRLALLKLIEASLNKEKINQVELYCAMGFQKDLLRPIENLLPHISDIIFEPLLSKLNFDLKKWHPSGKINTIAADSKWNFRSAAPFSYFALTRSIMGFLKVATLIDSKVNLSNEVHELLSYYETELENYRLENSDVQQIQSYQYLNIVVRKDDMEKVNLKLPFSTVYDLDSFISDEIKKKISSRGLDIDQLVHQSLNKDVPIIYEHKENGDHFLIQLIK